MSSRIKFIDSNVFVYAYLKPKREISEKISRMKEKAKEILMKINYGEERVVTSVVHISEIANVVESLSSISKSIEIIENILNNESIIVKDVTTQDYIEAVRVANREKVSVNDALAYVIMRNNNISEIYTFDEKHFKKLNVTIL
jgi:predicted nucleic acid-binding protein